MKIPFEKAIADPGQGHGNCKAHAHSHTGHMVAVTVKHGNAHVRHAGLLGQNVTFDLTGAKLVVADTNGDGSRTTADLRDGDGVLVKARLPHRVPGSQPFKAKMLIDQSAPTAPGAAD